MTIPPNSWFDLIFPSSDSTLRRQCVDSIHYYEMGKSKGSLTWSNLEFLCEFLGLFIYTIIGSNRHTDFTEPSLHVT